MSFRKDFTIDGNKKLDLRDYEQDKLVTTVIIKNSIIKSMDDLSYVFPNMNDLSIFSSHIDNSLQKLEDVPLTNLTIRDHNIKDIREVIPSHNDISTMDLSFGKIQDTRLPFVLNNLRALQIKSNEIASLSGMKKTSMPNIEDINFKNNQIGSLNEFPTNYEHLCSLNLSFNKIKSYPLKYPLTDLDISHNNLKEITLPSTIENVNLSSNYLEKIEFDDVPSNIKMMDVSNNNLKDMMWFPNTKGAVSFENNPIRSLKGIAKRDFETFLTEYYPYDLQHVDLSDHALDLLKKCYDSLQRDKKDHCNTAYNYVKHGIEDKIEIVNTSRNRSAKKLAKQYIENELECNDNESLDRIFENGFKSKMKKIAKKKCENESNSFPTDHFI